MVGDGEKSDAKSLDIQNWLKFAIDKEQWVVALRMLTIHSRLIVTVFKNKFLISI